MTSTREADHPDSWRCGFSAVRHSMSPKSRIRQVVLSISRLRQTLPRIGTKITEPVERPSPAGVVAAWPTQLDAPRSRAVGACGKTVPTATTTVAPKNRQIPSARRLSRLNHPRALRPLDLRPVGMFPPTVEPARSLPGKGKGSVRLNPRYSFNHNRSRFARNGARPLGSLAGSVLGAKHDNVACTLA